jgi:hypothetical protein
MTISVTLFSFCAILVLAQLLNMISIGYWVIRFQLACIFFRMGLYKRRSPNSILQ